MIKYKKIILFYKNLAGFLLLLFLSVYFLNFFMFKFLITHGDSMSPVIKNGSVIIINPHAYGLPLIQAKTSPNVGDIIALKNENNTILIKRVVAVSGQKIEWSSRYWLINDFYYSANENPPEWLLKYINLHSKMVVKKVSLPVPKGYVMVIGDNEKNSVDGRDFGFVKNSNVVGRVDRIITK